jgi:hypothetical protein
MYFSDFFSASPAKWELEVAHYIREPITDNEFDG